MKPGLNSRKNLHLFLRCLSLIDLLLDLVFLEAFGYYFPINSRDILDGRVFKCQVIYEVEIMLFAEFLNEFAESLTVARIVRPAITEEVTNGIHKALQILRQSRTHS